MKQLVEQWAKTLVQFPVSAEYIATHEGIDFTARTLAVMQQRVEVELAEFKPIENELESLPVAKVVHFTSTTMDRAVSYGPLEVPPTFEELLAELAGPQRVGEPMWDQFSSTMGEPSTTLGDIKKLYTALYDESRIAPTKSYVLSAAAVLQDVLTGRASH